MITTVIIVHLSGRWSSFHRRPMLSELAEVLPPEVSLLCVDRPVTLDVTWWHDPGRFLRYMWRSELTRISDRLYVANVRSLLHDEVLRKVPFMSRLNARILSIQIRKMVDQLTHGNARIVQWIYGPEQSWTRFIFPEGKLIYECYDEYTYTTDGQVRPGIRELETVLLAHADLMFVTTKSLLERRKRFTRGSHILPNGVPSYFLKSQVDISDPIDRIPHPRIGYVGVIREPADMELMRAVFEARQEWHLVLVGPIHKSTNIECIHDLANVHLVGARPFASLPSVLRKLDVGLIPYRLNSFSDVMRPLKLGEYLSAGLPVASCRLPELIGMEQLVSFFDSNRHSCESAIELALARNTPEFRQAAHLWAEEITWRRIAERDVLPALEQNEIFEVRER